MAQRQRRAAQSKPSASLKPFYIALTVIALAGVGWIFYSLSSDGEAAVAPVELTGLDDPQALLAAAHGVELGQADAPVKMLVFSDFTCPSCQHWVQNVEPFVKQDFVESGKVKLTYYDYPLGGPGQHQHGFLAARAARCAGAQDKFWDYHDVLFARQAEWSYENDPIGTLVDYAGTLGLDRGAFQSCLRSDEFADVVTANRKLGESLGVNGTPTVYVGARALGNTEWSRYPAVKAAIESQLGVNVGAGAANDASAAAGDTSGS